MNRKEVLIGGGKNRIYYLDVAKALCAFLVVYAHLFSGYSNTRLYIYAFHMPFFFLISGIFHKDKLLSKKTIITYFIRLVIPAIFFCTTYIVVYGIVYGIMKGDILSQFLHLIKETIAGAVHSGSMSNIPCWFLIALFFCKVFMDVLLKLPKIVMVILIAIGLYFHHFPFYINQAFLALPFYIFGYYTSKSFKSFNCENQKLSHSASLFLILSIISAVITFYNGRVSMTSWLFGNHSLLIGVPLFFINGIIGSLALISLSLLLSFKRFNIINITSKSLITILGAQWLFIVPYAELTDYKYDFPIPLLYSFLIVGICSLLHIIIEKYYPILIGKK